MDSNEPLDDCLQLVGVEDVVEDTHCCGWGRQALIESATEGRRERGVTKGGALACRFPLLEVMGVVVVLFGLVEQGPSDCKCSK